MKSSDIVEPSTTAPFNEIQKHDILQNATSYMQKTTILDKLASKLENRGKNTIKINSLTYSLGRLARNV